MLTRIRLLLSILSFMAFTTNPDPGKNDPPETPDPEDDPDDKNPPVNDDPPADRSTWTVEQWNDEIKRVAAKEKGEGRKAAQREYQQQQDKAKADAELAKQESEGKYEEAKQKLTSDLQSVQQERDRALEILKANIDTQWNAIPESVRSTYKGDEDDVLAKSAHMQQMQPIIAELAEKAKGSKAGGNPPNPRAASGKVEVPSAVPKQRMW